MVDALRGLSRAAAALAALVACAATPVRADPDAARVTAAIDADLPGAIADGEHVRLGEDAACSILLDSDALVELCAETSLVFERDRGSQRRIVSLDGGEIRIVVEPRAVGERIEIHTPAAIATLLGTIAHVAVDPQTGETTITSAHSRISVRSGLPGVDGSTVLEAGEQLTVRRGEPPPAQPRRLDPRELSELGGCLVDFHSAAADRDSREHGARLLERLAASDAANAPELPRAADPDSAGGAPPETPGDPLAGQEGVCVATDCAQHPVVDFGGGEPPPGSPQLN
ncbi:MAG TPA: FecR domain-containing protein [Myxococcota bacterium]|nr:FecR domain-containing protein [Myxococcota bacterium]